MRPNWYHSVTALLLAITVAAASAVAAAADPDVSPVALAAATPQQPLGLISCPPPTDNGTYPFPIDTSDLCGALGLDKPNNGLVCLLFGGLQGLLGAPLVCAKHPPSQTLKDLKGYYIPQPLPNRVLNGRIPATLPLSVMDTEGGTYNWLMMNLNRYAGWSACGTLKDKSPWQVPTDWRMLASLAIKENVTDVNVKANNVDFPVGVILKQGVKARQGSCGDYAKDVTKAGGTTGTNVDMCAGAHVVILVRGTLTAFEAAINFDYNLRADSTIGAGQVHNGFRRMVNELWTVGVKATLDREFVGGSGSSKHLTIAGQSLGGSVGILLAAKAEKYLTRACGNKVGCKPSISVVAFAAPLVGNPTFVSDFSKRINARLLSFKYDLVSQVPCSPKITTCPNAPVPTNSPKGYLGYARTGGRLPFGPLDMPVQSGAWSNLGLYRQKDYCDNTDSLLGLSLATHVCSYLCKTGMYTGEPNNWCLLWPAQDDEAAKGNYCLEGSSRSIKYPLTTATGLFPPQT